jgi:hypothetical protein
MKITKTTFSVFTHICMREHNNNERGYIAQ